MADVTGTGLPRQNVSSSKKQTESWQHQTVDAIIQESSFDNYGAGKNDIKKLYEYYNGVIDKQDYKHVLKPFGKERKNVPANINNYNIIKPIIDVLLGEKDKRPLRDMVTVANSDAVSRKEQELQKKIFDNLRDHMFAELEKQGIPTGLDISDVPPPEHVKEFFEEEYVDQRAILGQKALNFIKKYCQIHRKFRKAWFHFLISGECYSYRNTVNNEPVYEVLNPLQVDYDKDPNLEFVEDGDYAIIRDLMYPSSVVDTYYNELTPEEVNRLEDPQATRESGWLTYGMMEDDEELVSDERLVEVFRVFWKTRKKVGFVTYIDEFGQLQEKMVEEDYKVNKEEGETVEWKWINETWQSHRIDGDIYKRTGPVDTQRRSMDNPSKCKLPVNGRKYSNVNAANISIVSISVPYQLIYNIYKYRLELSIAKSKDIIGVMDINAIPKDWDMDKFMHFVETMGIMWVDYSKEGINLNPQQQSMLDLSIKTIESYISLLQSIRLELEEVTGVNRNRKGQVSQYEGKSVNQQAIIQSSTITEDLFQKFADFEQRDLQAMIDYSQPAWINGKKTSFVLPEGTVEFLNIEDTEEYANAEFGVFIGDSSRDLEKFDQLQQLAQAALQNGAGFDLIAEMLDAENFTELKSKISEAEENRRQLEQAQQEAEINVRSQEVAAKNREMDVKEASNIRDNQTEIEKALIEVQAKQELQDQKNDQQERESDRKHDLEEKKLAEEKRHNKVEETIDRVEAEVKKKQAAQKSKE